MHRHKMLAGIAAAGVTIAAVSCSGAYENAPRFSAAEEALYVARYEAQQSRAIKGGGLGSYDPLEVVEGASSAIKLVTADVPSIAASTLDIATEYAAAMNSSALIVWKDGAIEKEAYFGAFDETSLINSKSLAKPLSSIAIGRAIALGHVQSLDQPAADFLFEWKDDPVKSQITLRHLLGMRSGLLAQAPATQGVKDVLNRAYLHPRHDEVIIHEYPVTDKPGTRYEYSNANGEIIATIIERATGLRYGAFVSNGLLKPLGAEGGTIWVNRPGGTAHSGCCIQLPGQTWLRLAMLLLQDGVWNGDALLPAGYVTEMQETTALNPHAGLGVWVAGDYIERRGSLNPEIAAGRTYHSEPYLADDLFLFDGNGKQVVYMIPSQRLIILRTGGFPPEGKEWDNSFLPNLILRSLKETG